jgi:hypothetical protein
MRKLAGKLTYANVMASVAVFIALGAGAYAAINLPKNSVKSKHIAPGQVKPADLSKDVRALPFKYSRPSTSTTNTTILNKAGYRIVGRCESLSTRPRLEVEVTVPKSGKLIGLQNLDPGSGATAPTAGELPLEGGVPYDITQTGVAPNVNGERFQVSGVFLYTATGRTALLMINFVADDDGDRCEVSGALTPIG